MSQERNIPELKQQLYERLKASGWGDKLKGFLLSSEFDKVLNDLVKEYTEGRRFTPPLKTVFKAFQNCPYNELKVVFLGQDSYYQLGVADGMAFSCSNTGKPEASLRYIFKSIESTVYPDGYGWDPDLKRWAEQGVLLINTALTTQIGKPATHQFIWKEFITYLLDTISSNNPGIIWVFVGRVAQEWMGLIPDNCYKIAISHPASAAHQKLEEWDCENVWNKVNDILMKSNGIKINW